MKKKLISAFLIATLTISTMVGCGSNEKEKESASEVTATVEPTTTPTQEPTATPTLQPVVEPTKEATQPKEISSVELEEAGSVDGLTYTNSLIGFSITVPESWLVYDAENTYSYLVGISGGTDADIEPLKSQLNEQGVAYICYGTDTQFSENGGTDNLLVQTMNKSLFGGLDVEAIISSLSQMIQQQYTSLGAISTIGEAVKTTVGDQDVYQVSAVANMDVTVDETTTTQTVRQEYIIFMKNDVLVYMALSTALEDSAALAKTFIETLSFQ